MNHIIYGFHENQSIFCGFFINNYKRRKLFVSNRTPMIYYLSYTSILFLSILSLKTSIKIIYLFLLMGLSFVSSYRYIKCLIIINILKFPT